MGKGSKAKKPRRKFTTRAVSHQSATGQPPPAPGTLAERPTAERKARGTWAEPQGPMQSAQAVVALDGDTVGRLFERQLISRAEEQAARQFQAARSAYMAELPDVAQFKSCIAGSVPGYDDGEGNPKVIAEYRRLEALLTRPERTRLVMFCDSGWVPNNMPDYYILRSALKRIAGIDKRRNP